MVAYGPGGYKFKGPRAALQNPLPVAFPLPFWGKYKEHTGKSEGEGSQGTPWDDV